MAESVGFCDQCGTPIPRSNSQFCSSCGAELPALTEQASASPIPTPSGQAESLRQERVDDVSLKESNTNDDDEASASDNPLNFIGGSTIGVGWIWAVVVFFQHSDSWLWLGGYGWFFAIVLGPVYAVYEAFAWGEWVPVILIIAGWTTFVIGTSLIGKKPQSNRIVLGVLLCLTIYFLPFGVGLIRNKRAKIALFFVNMLGGWTIFIWIGALIWALIPRTRDTTVPVINSPD